MPRPMPSSTNTTAIATLAAARASLSNTESSTRGVGFVEPSSDNQDSDNALDNGKRGKKEPTRASKRASTERTSTLSEKAKGKRPMNYDDSSGDSSKDSSGDSDYDDKGKLF